MINHTQHHYFDSLGEKFDEYMSEYDVVCRKKLIFERLLKTMPLTGKCVLEIGCGTGRFSEEILARGSKLTVLDIGSSLVANVTGKHRCLGTTGDATRLPFLENSFEAVISSECIEHTPDPLASIEEMCRVCKPGGFICFTTPNRLWYPVLLISNWTGIRKFSGIENWIFPYQGIASLKSQKMTDIKANGCHLWPFQVKKSRPLLRRLDVYGQHLYPLMINFGLFAIKPRENVKS